MLKIDLHIHTLVSGHAHNTILEYIHQAKKLKMKVIGFSEHGPGDGETLVSEIYFKEMERLPKIIEGVRVLHGIEADIIDKKGNLDISDEIAKKLDYIMANFHSKTPYKNQGVKINTEAMLSAIRSKKINILTHPFNTKIFPVDIKKISDEACKYDVLLEIDIAYIAGKLNELAVPNLKIIIDTLKKHKKKLIVGSDAHNIWELADDSSLKKIQKEIGLTDNMIINNYPKELFKLLKINE